LCNTGLFGEKNMKENFGEHKSMYYHKRWEHGDHKKMLWCLLKDAKEELLKEKIKQKLEEVEGKKLDEIAQILVEEKMEIMKIKKEFWKSKMNMKEKIKEVFGEEESE